MMKKLIYKITGCLWLCIGIILLHSCFKNKTLKDKLKNRDYYDANIDISPTFGAPILNYTYEAEHLLETIRKSSLPSGFSYTFKSDEKDLGYFIFEGILLNFNVDMSLNTFDTSGTFYFAPILGAPSSVTIHEAQLHGYAVNRYDAQFEMYSATMSYNYLGTDYPLTLNRDHISVIPPISGGSPSITKVFTTSIQDPLPKMIPSTRVAYDFKVNITNKNGSTGQLQILPNIHIPAWVTLKDFETSDTLALNDVDLHKILSYNEDSIADGQCRVNELTLIAKITNRYPIAVSLQMELLDSNDNVLGNLLDNAETVSAASTNADYTINQPSYRTLNISVKINSNLYNNLKQTKKIIIRQTYNSFNNKDVKIYKSNNLQVKLNAVANTSVKGNINDIISTF